MGIYTRRNAITFCLVWLVGGILVVGEQGDEGLAGSVAGDEAALAAPAAPATPSFSVSQPARPVADQGQWDGQVSETGPLPLARSAPEMAVAPAPSAYAAGRAGGAVISGAYRGQSQPLAADPQQVTAAAHAAMAEDLRRALP